MIAALLDINVVLDVFLARLPWVTDSAAVLAANQRGEIVGHLSAVSIPAIFWHGSKAGHSSGVADVDARRRRPRSDADALGARWLSPAGPPAIPLLSLTKIRVLNPA